MPNSLTIRGPTGDMHKSVYDVFNVGIVNNSSLLEGKSKAQIQLHSPVAHGHLTADIVNLDYYLSTKSPIGHGHVEADVSDLDHDALKIAGVEIDDSAKEDQASLIYDQGTNKIIYSPPEVPVFLNTLQHVSITIPHGVYNASAAISAVDMDKTFLIYSGSYGFTPFEAEARFLIELIDTTNVRATRYDFITEIYVNCHVVELTSSITSIQRGVIDLTGLNQQDATINSVDTDKTFVNWLGILSDQTDPPGYCTRLTLLNSTTVRAYRADNSGVVKVSFEAVEFA